MWFEIHVNSYTNKPALFVGTTEGYYIAKLYSNKLTARIAAVVRGYKYCIK